MSGFRAAVVALCAAVLTGACAAGQQAQTADERPSIDGTYGSVGQMRLESVAIQAPSGTSYGAGSTVPLTVFIANNGDTPDRLTKISSPAFSGWNIVSSSSAGAASAGNPSPAAIAGGVAVGYGQQGTGANGQGSRQTVVLTGLAKSSAPLYPGMSVKITFSFARAGETTLTVPVELSKTPNMASLPGGEPSESA